MWIHQAKLRAEYRYYNFLSEEKKQIVYDYLITNKYILHLVPDLAEESKS